jgi:hypothetical protein
MHALQPRNPASRLHFYSWFLQSVVEGEISQQLSFFFDEVWFCLQGNINMQNNRYWSSHNPQPMTSCSARRVVGSVFFNETINYKRYVQFILGQFFPEITEEERLYGWFQQFSATANTAHTVYLCRLCPMSLGTESSSVVFGQHIHLI